MAQRLEALERLGQEQMRHVQRLQSDTSSALKTSAVIEQEVAYSIADKTENLVRGSHSVDDVHLTHKSAMVIWDEARDETKKRLRLERERDSRPMR